MRSLELTGKELDLFSLPDDGLTHKVTSNIMLTARTTVFTHTDSHGPNRDWRLGWEKNRN